MDPKEQLPEEPPERGLRLRLTRDLLIVVAAIAFFAFAILLAFLFPPGSSVPSATPTPAVVDLPTLDPAQPPTALPPETSDPAYPGTEVQRPPTTTPGLAGIATPPPLEPSPVASPDNGANGYPAPGDPFALTATALASGLGLPNNPADQTATALAGGPPTFAPGRATPIPGAQTTPGTLTPATTGTALPTLPLPSPTPFASPTSPPPPTSPPAPTSPPLPTSPPAPTNPPPSGPAPTAVPKEPPSGATEVPRSPAPTRVTTPTVAPARIDTIRGNVRWTVEQSPIILNRDQRLAAGSSLIIDPGVEVRLGPGVAFFVEGALSALGAPGLPVIITGTDQRRWDGIYGQPGSTVIMERVDISGGGNGGTLIAVQGATFALRDSKVSNNGGHIRMIDTRVDVRNTEIGGNDMPYGSAIDASFSRGGFAFLIGNRIGGNRLSAGAAPMRISNTSPQDTINMDVQGNLLIGENGPNFILYTNGPFSGSFLCNTLRNGTNGLSLKSDSPGIPGTGLTVRDNFIDDHVPPIEPVYLKYGIGRGATSDLGLSMQNNWWGSDTGPYDPERNPDGRGESVGVNLEFVPWLSGPPDCTPQP